MKTSDRWDIEERKSKLLNYNTHTQTQCHSHSVLGIIRQFKNFHVTIATKHDDLKIWMHNSTKIIIYYNRSQNSYWKHRRLMIWRVDRYKQYLLLKIKEKNIWLQWKWQYTFLLMHFIVWRNGDLIVYFSNIWLKSLYMIHNKFNWNLIRQMDSLNQSNNAHSVHWSAILWWIA